MLNIHRSLYYKVVNYCLDILLFNLIIIIAVPAYGDCTAAISVG
jgi:hypothetical protein